MSMFRISVAVAALALASCGASEPAPAVPPAAIGTAVDVSGIQYTVTSVERVEAVGNEYVRETASEGGTLIVVNYSIKNASGKPMEFYEKAALHLVDPAGNQYSADAEASTAFQMSADLSDKFMSDLNPGITTRAAEVFEVSATDFNAATWTLQVEGNGQRISLQ